MSLVTRCPACATTFKVVRDQLRISDGWVRCGRCSHVFDATLDLRDLDAEPPAALTPDDPNMPVGAAAHGHESSRDDDYDVYEEPGAASGPVSQAAPPVFPMLPDLSSPNVGIVADEPWPQPPPHVTGHDEAPSHSTMSVAALAPSLELDELTQVHMQKALRRERLNAVRLARAKERETPAAPIDQADALVAAPVVLTASESEPPVSPPPAIPSFLRAASSGVFWQSRRGRVIAIAGIVLAMLALALQMLQHQRDSLLARAPALRPLLERVCAVTGCQLAALRRIGDITIDGATFVREKVGDGYQFSFTLRNAATVPLAMPAIELSLLNTQEQAVVRRVLQPAEFGAPAELAARGERAASLSLMLTGAEAAALPPVAGFNVVAFYP